MSGKSSYFSRGEQMDKKKQPDNYRHQPRRTTAYALEALEARILLSADVAAAVQINQEQAVATPQPAAVTVLSAQADAQQTLSVADLLVREASSFATMGQQPTSMSSVVTSPTGIIPQQTQTVSDLLTRDPSLFNSLIQSSSASPSIAASDFSRLFPDLPSFAPNTAAVQSALMELGKRGGILDAGDDVSNPRTLITDPSKSLNNPDNPAMTAGMTFLGQFLDHDLTFDRSSILGQAQDPTTTLNSRTPAFDLDSVYGGGPIGSPQLYDQSSAGRGIKFLIEEIPGSVPESRGGVQRYDVPRDSTGQAIIGDPRNDENLVISQLHLAFEKFHNAVVDQISTTSGLVDPAEIFSQAQRLVQWHYQWIITHEFLPKTVGPELTTNELRSGPMFFDAQKDASIPVEFSTAAYRFGHSQVRPSYRANFGPEPGEEFFALIFDDSLSPSQDHADLRGGERAPRRFVDWQTFFDFGDGNARPNKKIDTHLSSGLFDLPTVPGPLNLTDAEPQSLAQRNLLRHLTFEIPSGQAIAQAMGLTPLPATAFADVKSLGLDTQTPLWFYILREAEVLQQGQLLGPVGGNIVADVFAGLLQHDPTSYLNQNPAWTPTLTNSGTFTMVDLLDQAGVVAPV